MVKFDLVVAELKEKRNLALQWEYKNKFQEVVSELKDYHIQKRKDERLAKEKEEYENSWYGYFMSFVY